MRRGVNLEELDQFVAEVLPERTVLSVIITPPGGGGAISSGSGSVAMAACTVSNTYTNPGILGLLAPQVYAGPIQTVTCVPAVIATYSG